MFNNEKIAR